MTGFCVILPCVPTWTYIPRRCIAFYSECGSCRFTARSCSHWTVYWPVAAQQSTATPFRLLVLYHGRGIEVDMDVSLRCVPMRFNFVILQKSWGNLTKTSPKGTWLQSPADGQHIKQSMHWESMTEEWFICWSGWMSRLCGLNDSKDGTLSLFKLKLKELSGVSDQTLEWRCLIVFNG